MIKPRKGRRAHGVLIAFVVCILASMSVGFLGYAGLIEKKLEVAFAGGLWLVAINLWLAGAIIEGEVHWLGGGLLASREKTPVRFWCFICSTFTLFNGAGLLILSSSR